MTDRPGPGGPASPAGAEPVCPRHPDRVAQVRCQRCDRPACPECQRPAAVGVHCVDCVRAAARRAPVRRTVLGARDRDGRPLVTDTLVAVCVASYVLQWVLGDAWADVLAFQPFAGVVQPWRFVTGALLHATSGYLVLSHLVFNMLALWVLGRELERPLGRWRFLALFVVSVVGGHVAVTLLASPFQVVIGASGGVFGLFGALVVMLRRLRRSVQGVLGIIGLNVVLGFVVPGIAWEAHLGGLVAGAALGAAFAYAPRHLRTPVAVGATVLLLTVMAVLVVARLSAG